MTAAEEFRALIQGFRGNLSDAQYRRGAFENSEDTYGAIGSVIQIAVVLQGLLEKTPVHPPELRQIASQIRALPLVSKVVADHPYVVRVGQSDWSGDLETLEFKLLEMLDYLPESKPLATNAEDRTVLNPSARQDRKTVKTRPRRARLRKARLAAKNLSPPKRRAQTVATFIRELDRLRPRMTGSESDYSDLAKENPHFKTFAVVRNHPELRIKVLNLQDHRRHIRLAQQMSAAYHGRELSTIQTDWKKHKPAKYRLPKR